VSAEQTAGRGRGRRVWHSPPGTAIYTTLIFRPQVAPDRLPVLSLVAGVAVAETIEELAGAETKLKWPNDVWLGTPRSHQKVAGILLTSSLTDRTVDHVLVGIGINVSTSLERLPRGATSLLEACGQLLAPDVVFATLLERIDHGYEAYLSAAGRPSLDPYRSRAALLGDLVTVDDAGRSLRGVYIGVDDDGALLLREASGRIQRVMSGDLVRGPTSSQRH